MRGEELLDTLENIDPALIERASRKPKKPWLRWTAVAACLALAVGICALFLPSPATEPSPTSPTMLEAPTVPSSPDPGIPPVKYVIYTGYLTTEGPQLPEDGGSSETTPPDEDGNSSSGVTYGDISDLDFSYSHRTWYDNSDAAPTVEFTFAGRTLQAQYSGSFTNSLYKSEDPKLRLLGIYDDYRCEKYDPETGLESFTVRFRHEDGVITFFCDFSNYTLDGPLTEAQAKTLGDAFVTEQFGEGFLTEYASQSVVPSSDNTSKTLSVAYTKTVCGYKTTDRVIVTYNMQGEVVGYNANTKGVFDGAEGVITPEAIAAAEEYLLSTLSPERTIGDKKLVMDADGTFYLYAAMYTYIDDFCMTHEMCINIT